MALHTSVLTLHCPDSSGIVADVATWIGSLGGNIVDAGETRDAENGRFVQRVEFTHEPASTSSVPRSPRSASAGG